MLLNRVEKFLMNNPARAVLQRQVEGRLLLEMGGDARGAKALEVGCGRGVGGRMILEQFGAATVDAFDLDPNMVTLAKERLASFGNRVRLWTGDVTQIEATDRTYDAVFDFGIIHHVPDWRAALAEIHRVLRPGGRFYAEEVLRGFILSPVVRRMLDHPLEDRFTHEAFIDALRQLGFTLIRDRHIRGGCPARS